MQPHDGLVDTQAARDKEGSARVSIIMPAYNAEKTIQQSIASVLKQTYREVELIIVNDYSVDASWELIEQAAHDDTRIKGIRFANNQGVAAARNAGIEAASGAYIAFLDSDDWWQADKLQIQLASMQQSGARVSYSAYQRFRSDGTLLAKVIPPSTVNYTDMLKSNRIGNLTGVYDRSLGDGCFKKIGHEDYVFWLDMVRRAGEARRVETAEPLAFYRVSEHSLSSDKAKAARWQWNIYRQSERLNVLKSVWYFTHYAINGVLKRQ